ncbi:MAG TPA: hypothetical protein VFE72_03790, partial [Lysobacter sp.]|nr:hypothetical protein [Lysobacter sp.]
MSIGGILRPRNRADPRWWRRARLCYRSPVLAPDAHVAESSAPIAVPTVPAARARGWLRVIVGTAGL